MSVTTAKVHSGFNEGGTMLTTVSRSVWAKSGYDPIRRRWLPLWLHLLDSAAVARHLAEHWLAPTIRDQITQQLGGPGSVLSPDEEFAVLASWIAGVHDIGKCTPAFSVQVPCLDDRMRAVGLCHGPIDHQQRRAVPHSLAGHVILESWLRQAHGWPYESAAALASIVGGHHGIPPTSANVASDTSGRSDMFGDDSWADAREELLALITTATGAGRLLARWSHVDWFQPFLVQLSGLVIISDWIASCEDYFPLLHEADDGSEFLTQEAHDERVRAGLSRIELPSPWHPKDGGLSPDALLSSRFDLPQGATATPIQRGCVDLARSMDLPGLLIVEESTGGGKTEAALMAAEILAARSGRSGVLFALPTQATTDAMFTRELRWLERIEEAYADGGAPSAFAVSLQHGRSRLNKQANHLRREGYQIRDRLFGSLGGDGLLVPTPHDIGRDETSMSQPGSSDSTVRRRADLAILSWFNGRKKSMLSDFVVTTVDHVLFTALRSPHLALRHLGLSRKVVIIDEVHSYSTYMNAYLDRALTWMGAYGIPVILLSATLSERRCAELVDSYRRGLTLSSGTRVPTTPRPISLVTPFPCLVSADIDGAFVTPSSANGRSSSVTLNTICGDDPAE